MSNKTTIYLFIAVAILFYIAGLITCNANKKDCPQVINSDTTKIKLPSDTGAWHKPLEDTISDSADIYPSIFNNVNPTEVMGSDNSWVTIGWDSVEYHNYIYGGSTGNKKLVLDGRIHSTTDHSLDYFADTTNPHTDSAVIINQLLKQYDALKNTYNKMVVKYSSVHSYTDTTHLKLGIVKVQTIVGNNTLIRQRTILDSAFQTIITNNLSAKEKTQLWFGIDAYGNKKNYLSGAGVSLLLKFKKGIGIDAGTYFDQYNNLNFHAGIRWLIKFHK